MSRDATEERLGDLLDRRGLDYRIRRSPDDTPYAGFRLATDGELDAWTAVIYGNVLQVSVHGPGEGVAPDTSLLWRINALNERWLVGRLFWTSEEDGYGVSAGAILTGPDDDGISTFLMEVAAAGVRAVRVLEEDGLPGRPEELIAEPLQALPAGAGDSLLRWKDAFEEAGVPMGWHHDQKLARARLRDESGDELLLEIFIEGGRVLVGRARPVITGRDDVGMRLREVQTLNRKLAFGCGLVQDGSAPPYFGFSIPLRWTPPSADRAHWLVDQSFEVCERLRSLTKP